MKFFRETTANKTIIMGRKTFESFPKPLPNRTHVIITRQANYEVPEGCVVVSSLTAKIEKP
jgi:dihydrofolate reductase